MGVRCNISLQKIIVTYSEKVRWMVPMSIRVVTFRSSSTGTDGQIIPEITHGQKHRALQMKYRRHMIGANFTGIKSKSSPNWLNWGVIFGAIFFLRIVCGIILADEWWWMFLPLGIWPGYCALALSFSVPLVQHWHSTSSVPSINRHNQPKTLSPMFAEEPLINTSAAQRIPTPTQDVTGYRSHTQASWPGRWMMTSAWMVLIDFSLSSTPDWSLCSS